MGKRDWKKYLSIKRLIRNSLNIIGIFDGEFAYKGPDCVQIDLTNRCNNNCIACWCNSPLLGDKATSPEEKSQTLDQALVTRLIDALARMGTRELYFSGGGEPLMHPNALDILEYAKKKGFCCQLHTNFTLADERVVDRLIRIGLDHLVVSLWAATPETYCVTHPNKRPEDFLKLKNTLTYLNRVKKDNPRVRIYNVISNLNYQEYTAMVELCRETGSERCEFTVVDTIPARTEGLLLSDKQSEELSAMCEKVKNDARYRDPLGRPIVENIEQFSRRLSSAHSTAAEYDKGYLDSMPCYVGWLFARIIADGNVNSCLKSHRMPIGNLYRDDFSRIWNGRKQREFRRATVSGKKDSPIFQMIGNDPNKKVGCFKSCDDLGRNLFMHQKINSLTAFERMVLKAAAAKCRLFSRKEL